MTSSTPDATPAPLATPEPEAPRAEDQPDLLSAPQVVLIARPQFLGVPDALGSPRDDQDQGAGPERLIEACGRVCYDSYGLGRDSEHYHEHLQQVGHGSVTEHATWSFYLAGVSRGLTHELVRHRVGMAYAQRSTRYVDESESPWVLPPLFRAQPEDAPELAALKAQGRAELAEVRRRAASGYARLMDLGDEILRLQAPDLSRTDRRKAVRGAARGTLGQSLETRIIFSANLRALLHICQMRCVRYAEAEIRIVAARLIDLMREEAPRYFARAEFGPSPDGLAPELVQGLPRMQPY